jgi:hypothetical protein
LTPSIFVCTIIVVILPWKNELKEQGLNGV